MENFILCAVLQMQMKRKISTTCVDKFSKRKK